MDEEYPIPSFSFEGVKSVKDLIREGLVELSSEGGGNYFMVDNRQYHISGVNGENLNINTGTQGDITQSIDSEMSSNLEKLVEELMQSAKDSGEPRDVEMVEVLKANIAEKKWEGAKTIFSLVTKTIPLTASTLTIAKALGWM